MASRYSREQLEGLRRVDLQRIGKAMGLKANLKSDALIDLILDPNAPQPPVPGSNKPPSRPTSRAASKPPSIRSTVGSSTRTRENSAAPSGVSDALVSTTNIGSTSESVQPTALAKPSSTVTISKPSSTVSRAPSLFSVREISSRKPTLSFGRPRDPSQSTVIFHEEDEDDATEPLTAESSGLRSIPPTVGAPAPRRKAKDTQFRLGVGRPILAGGSGARNVTASVNVEKNQMLSREPTIVEDVDEQQSAQMLPIVNGGSMAEPTSAPSKPPHAPYVGALPILDVVALKSEYDRHVKSLREELDGLQATVKNLVERAVETEALREEVRGLKTQLRLITNAPNSNSSNIASNIPPSNVQNQPFASKKTYPATLGKASDYGGLGKHSRESSADSIQAGSANVAGHESKRSKLGDKTSLFRPDADVHTDHRVGTPTGEAAIPAAPAFEVYEGPEENGLLDVAPHTVALVSSTPSNGLAENVPGGSAGSPMGIDTNWSSGLAAMLAPPASGSVLPIETPGTSNVLNNFLGTSPWAAFSTSGPRHTTPPMNARDGALLGLPAMHVAESPSERALKVVHRIDGMDISYDPEDTSRFWAGLGRG